MKIKTKIETNNIKTIHILKIQILYVGNAIKRDTSNTTVQKTEQTKKKEWLHPKKTRKKGKMK
jgi:hypothetical protein